MYSRDVIDKHTSRSFSALQRAENSSINPANFPLDNRRGFSALQRAENSSILNKRQRRLAHVGVFQCSSASRKFLNVKHGNVAA